MVDLYTKIVLTIIAAALCGLVIQNAVQPAAAVGEDCGGYFDPCRVEVTNTVKVTGLVTTY